MRQKERWGKKRKEKEKERDGGRETQGEINIPEKGVKFHSETDFHYNILVQLVGNNPYSETSVNPG